MILQSTIESELPWREGQEVETYPVAYEGKSATVVVRKAREGRPPASEILTTFRHHHKHSGDKLENLDAWIDMTQRSVGYFNPPWRDARVRAHANRVLWKMRGVYFAEVDW